MARKKRNQSPHHRCTAIPAVLAAQLRAWYQMPLGASLLASEQAQLDAILPDLFGYHLLQLGDLTGEDLTGASRIPHRAVMGEGGEAGTASPIAQFHGQSAGLPVACDSIDVAVLHHALEFSTAPHEVLREVDRCLIPEGHIVLLGFNVWSVWMLWRLLTGWRGQVPWCGRFLSAARVKDWLRLLGFDIVHARAYFFRPPVQHIGLMRRLRFLEPLGRRIWPVFGGGYVIVARKRVTTLTPIRPRWRPRRRLIASGVAEPFRRDPPCR